MSNHKSGSQRYNEKMDKIFSKAMSTMSETKKGKLYDHRFYRENKKGEIVKLRSLKSKAIKKKMDDGDHEYR